VPRIIVISAILFLTTLLALPVQGASIKVVATIFPLADITRQIGGNRIDVMTLLPVGASEHSFEPTASRMRQVSGARLLIRVGAGMDAWAEKLFAAAKDKPATVTVTEGIKLIRIAEQEMLQGKHDHDHGNGDDPHVWLDPLIVRDSLVPKLVTALSRLSPADAAYFKANAERFKKELTAFDAEARSTVAALPRKEFIAMHSAWGYLAKRYGLRQIAAIEPFPGKEPSARYIAAVIALARKQRVRAIFAEPQLPVKTAQVIAGEIGGSVLILDPVGGEKVEGKDGYLSLMRTNLATIREGMK
jgi:zinc transport system substrate-binding protein